MRGHPVVYMPYEGLISPNQSDRKLDVYDRKLVGSHSTQGLYFDKYLAKIVRIHYTNGPIHHRGVWASE